MQGPCLSGATSTNVVFYVIPEIPANGDAYSYAGPWERLVHKQVRVTGELRFQSFNHANKDPPCKIPGDYYYMVLQRTGIRAWRRNERSAERRIMNPRTLSSAQTFWMKYVMPTIWISMFGLGTLGLFLGVFHGPDNAPPEEWMKWGFLAAWIAGTIFIYWTCARLKRVRIDDSAIYASNYVKEIRIPFDAVADVTENRWINIHPVTIHLRSTTEFGECIIFMPKMRIFNRRSHPVVAELRELAHA